jgi:hypothetical protein
MNDINVPEAVEAVDPVMTPEQILAAVKEAEASLAAMTSPAQPEEVPTQEG